MEQRTKGLFWNWRGEVAGKSGIDFDTCTASDCEWFIRMKLGFIVALATNILFIIYISSIDRI